MIEWMATMCDPESAPSVFNEPMRQLKCDECNETVMPGAEGMLCAEHELAACLESEADDWSGGEVARQKAIALCREALGAA